MSNFKWPFQNDQKETGLKLLRNTLSLSNPRRIFYQSSEFISIRLKLDKEKTKELLPACLWVHEDLEAYLFFAKHHHCIFADPYCESGILVKTKSLVGPAFHFIWCVVNSELGQLLGREMLGVPKKIGTISWGENEVNVERKNQCLFKVSWKDTVQDLKPQKVFGNTIANVGGLGQFFLLQPIWAYRSPEKILDAKSSKSYTLEVQSDAEDIFSRFGFEVTGELKKTTSNIYCSPFLLPIGFAGPNWAAKTFSLRYS